MTGLGSDYINLIASGDERRIKCVLAAALGGAVSGGLTAGVVFAPANVLPGAGQAINGAAAGVGAVLGTLGGAKLGIKMCASGESGDNFDRLFSQDKLSSTALDEVSAVAASRYGLGQRDAERLAKAALVYRYHYGRAAPAALDEKSSTVAVQWFLQKLDEKTAA